MVFKKWVWLAKFPQTEPPFNNHAYMPLLKLDTNCVCLYHVGTAAASTAGTTLPYTFGLDRLLLPLFQRNDPGAFRPVIQEDSMMGDHSSYHNAIPGTGGHSPA